MHLKSLVKFCQFVLKILSGNGVLVQIKGHNSGTNIRNRMCNNPKLDLVNINAYIRFGENLSSCFQDIELTQKSGLNQGPFPLNILRTN